MTKFGRECVCGRGGECQGVSAAFALLKDPRKGYVLLPSLTPEPTCFHEVDMNAMRASYLRHLRRTEASLGDSKVVRYVALHHFHPTVVLKHAEMSNAVSPVPKTVRKVDLEFLQLNLSDEDRVRDNSGRKRKQYYFVPNWPIQSSKDDLKSLIRVSRIYQEAKKVSPALPQRGEVSPMVAGVDFPNGDTDTPMTPRNLDGSLESAAVTHAHHQQETTDVASQPTPATVVVMKDMVTEPSSAKPLSTAEVITSSPDIADSDIIRATGSTPGAETEAASEKVLDNDVPGVSLSEPVGAAPSVAIVLAFPCSSTVDVDEVADAPKNKTEVKEIDGDAVKDLDKDQCNILPSGPEGAAPSITSVSVFPHSSTVVVEEVIDAPEEGVGEGFDDVALSEQRNEGVDDAAFALSAVPITKRIFDTVYDGERLPSHLSMESEEGRKFLFRRMSKFEARRVEVVAPLVEEFVVRWTASLRVMQAGIFEMARAERLIRGAALANKAYAEAMQANFEDVYLDSEGNAITDKRLQSRIAKEREVFELSMESNGGSPEKARDAHSRNAVFGSIVNSQQIISVKFSENYDSVNESVVSELENLRKLLKEEMVEFKRRGEPLIRDIQGSETEVQTTFAVFDIVGPCPGDLVGLSSSLHSSKGRFRRGSGGGPMPAAGSYHGSPVSRSSHASPGSFESPSLPIEHSRSFFGRRQVGLKSIRGGSNHGGSSHGSTVAMSPNREDYSPHLSINPALLSHASSPVASLLRGSTIVRDGWLIEMLYRGAVNAQILILQQCGAALENIWQMMHKSEVTRRIRLHEVMLDFMPRQRRLFLGLTPIAGTILNDLVEQRTDPKQLDDQLEEDIRKHRESLLKLDNSKRSHIMNRSRTNAPNFEELHGMLTGEFFDNGLLRAATVAERKAGVLGNWKTSLVVVTGDNYLHIFDVSYIPEVVIGSPAESVFELLLPDYQITQFGADVICRREDSLLKNLTPIDSSDLSKCSSYVSDDARTMDIVESVKGIIGFDATRKLTLRMISPKENQEWLAVLQSCHGIGGKTTQISNPQVLEEEQQALRAVQNVEAKLARV